MIILITGRNEVLAKVIFLHLFVILFTGGLQFFRGGSSKFPGGVSPNFRGGGGVSHFRGGFQIFGGRGVPPNFWEGVSPNFRGGPIFWGGGVLQFLGGSPNFSGGGGLQFSEYGQCSAGTHPTGMHSCFHIFFVLFCSYRDWLRLGSCSY